VSPGNPRKRNKKCTGSLYSVHVAKSFSLLPTLLGFPNIAMRLHSGAEERGVGYRVKEARIYVQLQLQGTSCSRPVLRSRP
jgi:hypothetical protein